MLIKADYNQLEMRVLAESGNVANLVSAYQNRDDTHRSSALEIVEPVLYRHNGPAYEAWLQWEMKQKRWFGKNGLNFPSVYGVAADKLVEQANKNGLPLTTKEAAEILKLFGRRYPQIEEHRSQYQAIVQASGEARTLYNRRRIFSGLAQYDRLERSAALREGFNHRIQGTAADLFKLALLRLWREGLWDDTHRAVNYIHDEIVFYAPEGDIDWCRRVKETMESVTSWQPFDSWPMREWSVPLEVEVSVGTNWYDALPIDTDT